MNMKQSALISLVVVLLFLGIATGALPAAYESMLIQNTIIEEATVTDSQFTGNFIKNLTNLTSFNNYTTTNNYTTNNYTTNNYTTNNYTSNFTNLTNYTLNSLSGDILGFSSNIKFLNTLLGIPVTNQTNIIDVSGNNHNGIYNGTWVESQKISKGLGWMLSPNGIDNYINLGDSNDFSFGDGLNDVAFSIGGVIEVVNTTGVQVIVSKWNEVLPETREWIIILLPSEKLEINMYDESANANTIRTTDAALSVGFHTFVVTYSGVGGATAGNGITIYVDGAVVASTATNNANYVAMENSTIECWLGAYTSTIPAGFMKGDFTPPIIDKGTVWTAAQVNRFHQYMKGVYDL